MKLSFIKRRSGILLHPTSLPGPYPTGDFGQAAYDFVDWLAAAGQTLWQVLPLSPPDGSGSPYASHSAFGMSSLLLDLQQMYDLDLLCDQDLIHRGDYSVADYAKARQLKYTLIAHSYGHFLTKQDHTLEKEFKSFCAANAWWLDDHALFDAIRKEQGNTPWFEWPPELKGRDPQTLATAQKDLAQEIIHEQYAQWLVHRQWLKLKSYANGKGVLAIGDLPFFVQHNSVDVWVRQEEFLLDATGLPTVVAGAPPDMFSAVGQRWGNPIYNWSVMSKTKFEWWRRRMQYAAALFDVVRLDHFRGFQGLWHIPASAADARTGSWVASPSEAILKVLTHELGGDQLIAEDLGFITDDVARLRHRFRIAGTKVMQFGFSGNPDNPSLPHTYDADSVVYTGTHDTAPLNGWIEQAPADQKKRALAYTGAAAKEFGWSLIEKGEQSKARWAILQLQDVLGLGNKARMNTPNTLKGNWSWRMDAGVLTPPLAKQLRELAVETKRL